MSVLTGLISGAAKGALDAGKVVMDQELKKQLLEIQAQKELMLAEARSRLDVEAYKTKGDYDTSQIGVKAAATAQAAKDNAGILGEAAAAQETAKYAASTSTRLQQEQDARAKADADETAKAKTYMSPEVQAAKRREAELSPSVIAAGIQRQLSDGVVTLQQTADGRLMKVDKKGNTLGYLTDPEGKEIVGTRDVSASNLAIAKSYFDEALKLDEQVLVDPTAAQRAEAKREQGRRIIMGEPTKKTDPAATTIPGEIPGVKPKNPPGQKTEAPVNKTEQPAAKFEPAPKAPALIRDAMPQNNLFDISDFTKNEGVNKARNELAILEKQFPVAAARSDSVTRKIAELKAKINGAQ